MRAAVIVFPGSNCDRDTSVALERATGRAPAMIWHRDTGLPPLDLIVLPGGFSYGDYLRSGAMAARSPVMRAVAERARAGVPCLGICNGFQVLVEAGLLPGAMLRNAGLRFVCRYVDLRVERARAPFTHRYEAGETIRLPLASMDGNYQADPVTLERLEGDGRVAFRYASDDPNGSARRIAGIWSETGTILGLMPHPERAADPLTGCADGARLFEGLVEAVAA